jgi:hypothetical protein
MQLSRQDQAVLASRQMDFLTVFNGNPYYPRREGSPLHLWSCSTLVFMLQVWMLLGRLREGR